MNSRINSSNRPKHRSLVVAAAVTVLLGILAGCNPEGHISVVSEYGKGIKFSGLGPKYSWASGLPAPLGPPEMNQRIRTSAERHLAEKGFVQVPESEADFLLAHRVHRREKTDASVNPHGEVYEEGSLILEVLDPAAPQNPSTPGSRIWRGIARARIMDSDPPELREKRMESALKALMDKFPEKAGGKSAS